MPFRVSYGVTFGPRRYPPRPTSTVTFLKCSRGLGVRYTLWKWRAWHVKITWSSSLGLANMLYQVPFVKQENYAQRNQLDLRYVTPVSASINLSASGTSGSLLQQGMSILVVAHFNQPTALSNNARGLPPFIPVILSLRLHALIWRLKWFYPTGYAIHNARPPMPYAHWRVDLFILHWR